MPERTLHEEVWRLGHLWGKNADMVSYATIGGGSAAICVHVHNRVKVITPAIIFDRLVQLVPLFRNVDPLYRTRIVFKYEWVPTLSISGDEVKCIARLVGTGEEEEDQKERPMKRIHFL